MQWMLSTVHCVAAWSSGPILAPSSLHPLQHTWPCCWSPASQEVRAALEPHCTAPAWVWAQQLPPAGPKEPSAWSSTETFIESAGQPGTLGTSTADHTLGGFHPSIHPEVHASKHLLQGTG